MDELILVELSHEVLSEVPVSTVHLNPLLSEKIKFFLQLIDDKVSWPDLALLDALSSQDLEFSLENFVFIHSIFAGIQEFLLFFGENSIFSVQLLHALGIFCEFLGGEKLPSKLRWGDTKEIKGESSPLFFLLLGPFEHSICRPGVRIVHFVDGIVAFSCSSDFSNLFGQLSSKLNSFDSVLKLIFCSQGIFELGLLLRLLVFPDGNLFGNI